MSDTPGLEMLLRTLHLSGVVREYQTMAASAQTGEWGYARYLRALMELEVHERRERRIAQLLKRSGLPPGKSLATRDQKRLPMKVRRQIPVLIEGGFVERAENILAFGLPGRGKTYLLAAIALEPITGPGYTVWFTPTRHLVEKLLVARRDLRLEELLKKLDRFDVILLGDIGYVQQSREEMEVLFTFLSERHERRSLMITSNLVFSEWDRIFKDPMTTVAAIDRLIHHSIILELDNPSYRAEAARSRQDQGN